MTSNNSEHPRDRLHFDIPAQLPPDASNDEKAESEAAALAFDLELGSAKTAKKLANLSHRAALDGTISKVLRGLVWFGSIVACLSFSVLFFHFLAPEGWLFLSPERLLNLKELLFSGTFGAGLAALWRSQENSDEYH